MGRDILHRYFTVQKMMGTGAKECLKWVSK